MLKAFIPQLLFLTHSLGLKLAELYHKTTDQVYGLARLAKWHDEVRQETLNHLTRSLELLNITSGLFLIILITEVPTLPLNPLMPR
jgi:hypothetical protein